MRCEVIYEDKDVLVIYKPSGLATQSAKVTQADVVSEICNYLGTTYLGLVHRLDQPVEGLLVLAKNKKAAASLSSQLTLGELKKTYCAALYGNGSDLLLSEKVTLEDYLIKNVKSQKAEVIDSKDTDLNKDKKPVLAKLQYSIIKQKNQILFADINLMTGRFHQIRAQMSHAGLPLLGDLKYGSAESIELSKLIEVHEVALCANKISFQHPVTAKKMEFSVIPHNKVFDDLSTK